MSSAPSPECAHGSAVPDNTPPSSFPTDESSGTTPASNDSFPSSSNSIIKSKKHPYEEDEEYDDDASPAKKQRLDADPAFLRREIRGIDTKIAREQKKINNLLQKINMCNNNIAQLNKTRFIHLSSYESFTGKTYEPVTSSKRARNEGREAAPTHPSKAAQKDSESKSSSDEKAPVAPGGSVAVQATKGTGHGKDDGTSVKKPVNGTAKETAAQVIGKAIDKAVIVGTVDIGIKGAADKTVNGNTVVEDGHMSAQVSDDHSDNEAMI